jgi:hypothetical protein
MAGYDWGAFYTSLGIPAAQANGAGAPPTLGNPKATPLDQGAFDGGHDAAYWNSFYGGLQVGGQATAPGPSGSNTYGFPAPPWKAPGGATTFPVPPWLAPAGSVTPTPATGDPVGGPWNSMEAEADRRARRLRRRTPAPMSRTAPAASGQVSGMGIVKRLIDTVTAKLAGSAPALILTPKQVSQSTPEYIAAVNSGSKGYTPSGTNLFMPTTTISGTFRQNYGDSGSSYTNGSLV